MLAAVKPVMGINRTGVKVKDIMSNGGKAAETDTDMGLDL